MNSMHFKYYKQTKKAFTKQRKRTDHKNGAEPPWFKKNTPRVTLRKAAELERNRSL